mgnify:CR=1 FL=1
MNLLTSHFRNACLAAAATISFPLASALADQQPIPHTELDRLITVIKPQSGESPWREIDWLTDLTEARRRAIAEDKPLVIFTAADGSPLGRT